MPRADAAGRGAEACRGAGGVVGPGAGEGAGECAGVGVGAGRAPVGRTTGRSAVAPLPSGTAAPGVIGSRSAACRSLPISAADWYRSAGSLAIAVRRIRLVAWTATLAPGSSPILSRWLARRVARSSISAYV